MPHELDDIDIRIVTSLQQDGRKSFRQISRETGVSTPTVQARFQRLVNIGLIKSISPVIDPTIVINKQKKQIKASGSVKLQEVNLKPGMSVKMECDLCEGPIGGRPHIFKFASFERFFCCITCKTQYKEKNRGRIQSIIEQAKEN